jgi:low affinity Fe/Cu permease
MKKIIEWLDRIVNVAMHILPLLLVMAIFWMMSVICAGCVGPLERMIFPIR